MKTKDGSNKQDDAGKPTDKRKFEYGFTSIDNRLFYLQQDLTPSEFSVFVRIYRATEGYDGRPKALAGTYFKKVCNMSKNTVTSAIKGLEKEGLIFVKKKPKSTSFYLVNLERMDDMYQEIKREIIEGFESMADEDNVSIPNIGSHNDDTDNLDSQNLTMTIPKSDHVIPNIRPCDSHILGSNKEKFKEKSKEKIYSDNEHEKPAAKSQTKKPAVANKLKFEPTTYQVPFFIDTELWVAYHNMRSANKKHATEYACKLIVKNLTKFNEKGLDANQSLENSIKNGWTDVYEPKQSSTTNKKGINHGQSQSASQQISQADIYRQSLRGVSDTRTLATVERSVN